MDARLNLKWLISIVPRGRGNAVAQICNENHIAVQLLAREFYVHLGVVVRVEDCEHSTVEILFPELVEPVEFDSITDRRFRLNFCRFSFSHGCIAA